MESEKKFRSDLKIFEIFLFKIHFMFFNFFFKNYDFFLKNFKLPEGLANLFEFWKPFDWISPFRCSTPIGVFCFPSPSFWVQPTRPWIQPSCPFWSSCLFCERFRQVCWQLSGFWFFFVFSSKCWIEYGEFLTPDFFSWKRNVHF